jgi:hypothetical protein
MANVPHPDPASTINPGPDNRFTSAATTRLTRAEVGIGEIPFRRVTSTIDKTANNTDKIRTRENTS